MAENTNILEINGLHKNFFIRGRNSKCSQASI